MILFLIISIVGCQYSYDSSEHDNKINIETVAPMINKIGEQLDDTTKFTISSFYTINVALAKKVDSVYDLLSITERAAQLIMQATSEYKSVGFPYKQVRANVINKQIGGVLYLKGTTKTFSKNITELNELASKNNMLPLINSCDCEPTLFHKKFTDMDSVTAANEMVTNELIDNGANIISTQMKKMGIQINFAPIADIAYNQDIIKTRSFSADPTEIVERASRFVTTTQSLGIAATIKHFPGHGAVVGDSHKNLVFINGPLTEVNTFKSIIAAANPIAVMVGHLAIENNPLYEPNVPATLSRKIITDLLKKEIGFKGIVVTDAMQMRAVALIPNASWKALVAGADLIIIPMNVAALHNQIKKELTKKEGILKKQFEASIKKIIRLKICTGLIK